MGNTAELSPDRLGGGGGGVMAVVVVGYMSGSAAAVAVGETATATAVNWDLLRNARIFATVKTVIHSGS